MMIKQRHGKVKLETFQTARDHLMCLFTSLVLIDIGQTDKF